MARRRARLKSRGKKVPRGKRMTKGKGWRLVDVVGKNRQFVGTLVRTFRIGKKRLAVFIVRLPKKAKAARRRRRR